jgi:glycosyltransferase involved in cell wall biosynthesis
VGRFEDIKNPFLALEILEKLEIKATLLMVGDGILFQNSKSYAKTKNLNVIFTGWSLDPEEYISAADLHLLTSRNEGFGLVILEAAKYKIPTLSLDVGGVSEFIKNGKTGVLLEPTKSAEEIALEIRELQLDQKRSIQLGENAFEFFMNDFTVTEFVQNQVRLYRQIMY